MAQQQPERETLYEGKFIRLVRLGKWEFATRPKTTGIVGIVPVTDDGKLLLIEQYRAPVGRRVVELPAGLAGDVAGQETEELAAAARRELLEETGYEARQMTEVGSGPPSAGLSDEFVTMFVARGLRKVSDDIGDGSEEITVHEVPLGEVPGWLTDRTRDGCLIDLKVYAGLYFVSGR